jgi:hypothetical protein
MIKLIKFFLSGTLLFFSMNNYAQNYPINLEYTEGKIKAVINAKGINRHFFLESLLPQTGTGAGTEIILNDGNTIKTSKSIRYFEKECIVVNTIAKTSYGLQWDIEIKGTGKPWTVPVQTILKWDANEAIQFWTAWPDNQTKQDITAWQDPFETAPLQNLAMVYGGETHWSVNAFSIPIASSFIKDKNIGLSFIQSLQDSILDLEMHTSLDGSIAYSHINHRISNENTIHIRQHIVLHEADWRAGINWMYENYKTFFLPQQPLVNEMAGCGAYSSYEGELDTAKYKKMAFSINWKASLDFPYMGMFIPPVKSDEEKWLRYKQGGITVGDGYASVKSLKNYSGRFKKMGFHTLSYFNVTEFGNKIIYPYQQTYSSEKEYWKNANDFLYNKLSSALLRPQKIMPDWDSRPIYSNWEDCVAMDPGDSAYQSFLLQQAKQHIEKIPASSGICIDRLDWLRYYNGGADDGVSFVDGNKTRSLILSFKDIMAKLGPLMHQNNKVIFCNTLYRRIDLMKEMDGIYDEFGNNPHSLNLCAQMAMFKPIIAWTISKDDFKPNPDAYFQHHLYMGAFLTVPFPGNDHTINPDSSIEKYYLDYGLMLQAIKGRQWVLSPNVVALKDGNAKANIFKVNEKIIIPVIHGQLNEQVVLLLKLPYQLLKKDKLRIKVLYPGESKWKNIGEQKFATEISLPVRLKRGCALISLE